MRSFKPEGIIRENILRLKPYASARSEFKGSASVMLDANENPFALEYGRYPDPLQQNLKARISVLKNVAENRIFVGNGSDEAIDLLIRIACRPGTVDHVLLCPPTYGMYEVSAATNDVAVVEIPLRRDFQLDVPAILDAIGTDTKVVFLCSPNNPTGNLLRASDIGQVLDAAGGLVVIDEAYIDFCGDASWISRLEEYPNLVILQTCSKAWGLAGLRIGMAFAHPDLVGILNKVKPPYNMPSASQQLGLEALQDIPAFTGRVAEILKQRESLKAALEALPYVRRVFRSDANFLLVQVVDANAVYDWLLSRGIVVRNRHTTPGCLNCIRITIGTPEQNGVLIETMKQFLQ